MPTDRHFTMRDAWALPRRRCTRGPRHSHDSGLSSSDRRPLTSELLAEVVAAAWGLSIDTALADRLGWLNAALSAPEPLLPRSGASGACDWSRMGQATP